MLLGRGALEREQKNADILIKETDGVARIFAELITNQFRLAIP